MLLPGGATLTRPTALLRFKIGPTNSTTNPPLVHISIIFAHKHIADQ